MNAGLRLTSPSRRAWRPQWLTTRRALVALVAVAAMVLAVGPTHNAAQGPASATAATTYVADRHRGLHIPAIATVAISGQHTSVRSFGAKTEQPFVIGSVTKSFTALAVMQLVQSGKVRLDEPAVTYLPGFHTRNRSASDRITVKQLLSQTSGLTTDAGLIGFQHPATSITRQVSDLSSVTTKSPGTFRYSNANFEVLGELIATVSGTSLRRLRAAARLRSPGHDPLLHRRRGGPRRRAPGRAPDLVRSRRTRRHLLPRRLSA